MRKRIVVFASGTKTGGGSGFQELVENSRTGVLEAEIVGVVSQHSGDIGGGVEEKAVDLGIPFMLFPENGEQQDYLNVMQYWSAEFAVFAGWTLLARGLDPRTTINIHPAPLPEFGGKGMYGRFVHEAVFRAYRAGKIKYSAVSMHFVTEEYDKGPVFFRYPVLIRPNEDVDSLQSRVNKIEHAWQSFITNLAVQEQIFWDGKDSKTLVVPSWYPFHIP